MNEFPLRTIAAFIVGGVAALIAYWVGAVIALLAMRGIPLGSPGEPPTPGEIWVHLVLGAVATFLGARLAMRIAARRPDLHAVVLGLLVATVMLVGFSKPASNWPTWFGATMGVACMLGSVVAISIARRR